MPNLSVNVKKARNLIAADVSGSSDPYAVVKIGPKGQKQKTKVIKKNLNPVWNQVLNFKFNEDPNVTDLFVQLFDQDFITDDPLGFAVIPLSDLTKGKPTSRVYTLESVAHGEIEVELTAIDFSTPPRQVVSPPVIDPKQDDSRKKPAVESPSIMRDITSIFSNNTDSGFFKKISQLIGDKNKTKQKAIPSLTATAGLDACIQACTKEVRSIVAKCRESGTKYVDPSWDPSESEMDILFGNPRMPVEDPDCITDQLSHWERLTALSENPQLFIDGVEPGDINQGQIGDCYLLSALSIVAVLPQGLDTLFIDYDIEVGVYGVRFFIEGDWTYVIIDDLVPINHSGDFIMAKARGGEMWVPLLEKAYAKLFGSFAAIGEGGLMNYTLEDLTGGVCAAWNTEMLNKEKLWDLIFQQNSSASKLFGCSFKSAAESKEVGRCGEPGGNFGLVGGHAYGILKVVEIQGQKLINCRNPWHSTEWEGPWSDGSAEWKKYPQIKQALNQIDEDDGAFWMHLDQFYDNLEWLEDVTIFSSKWKLAQFDIPGYEPELQIYFAFTVPKGTHDLAICLSQPTNSPGLLHYKVAIGFRLMRTHRDKDGLFLMNEEDPTIFQELLSSSRAATVTLSLKEGDYLLIPDVDGEVDLHLRIFSKNTDVEVFDLDFSGGGARGREEGENLRQALLLLASGIDTTILSKQFQQDLEKWKEQVNLSVFPAGIADELLNLEQAVTFPKKTMFKKKPWEKKCQEAFTFGAVAELTAELEKFVTVKPDFNKSNFDNMIKREKAKEQARQSVRDAVILLETHMGEHSVAPDFFQEREDWMTNVQESNTPNEIASTISFLESCTQWDSADPDWYNRRSKWGLELKKAKDWGTVAILLIEFEGSLGLEDVSKEWQTLRIDWIETLAVEVKKMSIKESILEMEYYIADEAVVPDYVEKYLDEFDSAVMRSLKPSHMAKQLLKFEERTIQTVFDDKWDRKVWRETATTVKTWSALAKLLLDFEVHFKSGFNPEWEEIRPDWLDNVGQWLDDDANKEEQEQEGGAEEEAETKTEGGAEDGGKE